MANQKVWYFIDIDGCIMPNMFNNAFYKNDKEKLISITSTYKIALEKDIQLYPEFIEWFKKITSDPNYDIEELYFITGRQENCFGWLTDKQLEPLQEIHWYHIHYYYSFAKHNWELYKKFKVHTILDYLEHMDYHGLIKIYDDMDLLQEFKEALNRPFEFYQIKDKEDWNRL